MWHRQQVDYFTWRSGKFSDDFLNSFWDERDDEATAATRRLVPVWDSVNSSWNVCNFRLWVVCVAATVYVLHLIFWFDDAKRETHGYFTTRILNNCKLHTSWVQRALKTSHDIEGVQKLVCNIVISATRRCWPFDWQKVIQTNEDKLQKWLRSPKAVVYFYWLADTNEQPIQDKLSDKCLLMSCVPRQTFQGPRVSWTNQGCHGGCTDIYSYEIN